MSRGGVRPGAGRPRKDPTQVLAVRLPVPIYEDLCAQAEAEGKKPGTLAAEWITASVAKNSRHDASAKRKAGAPDLLSFLR